MPPLVQIKDPGRSLNFNGLDGYNFIYFRRLSTSVFVPPATEN